MTGLKMKTYGDLVALIREYRAPFGPFASFLSNVLPGNPAIGPELAGLIREKRALVQVKANLGPVVRAGQNPAAEWRRYQNAVDELTIMEKQIQARIDDLEAEEEEYALASLKGAAECNEPLSPRIGAYDLQHIFSLLMAHAGRAA